jgi:hypothetical protein
MANPNGNIANLIPFKPGQSGNPAGRALGARNKLQTSFLEAMAADFEAGGKEAIRQARERNPIGYVRAIASLFPRQIELADLSRTDDDAVLARIKEEIAAREAKHAADEGGST